MALKYYANTDQSPRNDSLSYGILEALKSLKEKLERDVIDQCLDDGTKYASFSFVSDKNLTTIKLVSSTYELPSSKDLFLDDIKSLVFRRKFKEAGQLAIELDLCNNFTIADMLLPLYLEDKQGIFEEYFAKADQLQPQMIEFLDSLLEPNGSVVERCQPWIEKLYLKNVNKDKLNCKSVHKLIRRLSTFLSKDNVDKLKTPNNQKYSEEKELSFIIKFHYEAKKSSRETFLDNVKDYIKADPEKLDLQLQLIQQCFDYEELDDVQMFIEYFKIPEHLVPEKIQHTLDQGMQPKKPKITKKQPCNDDGWSDDEYGPLPEEEFYELTLQKSQIFIVDTVRSYMEMFDRLNYGKVAFDTEFTSKNSAAILQLAISDAVFIVDIIRLQELNMNRNLWTKLANEVFNNDAIIKLGFDFFSDLNALRKVPGLEINEPKTAYRDLQTLSEKAFEKPDFRFPFHTESFRERLSLSKLVKLCFGKELNKGDRLSNWCRRPLHQYQIQYAALDAFVLLEIDEILAKTV